ncbi:hypothetical protein CDV31_014277 [Fusarium ambrosium]|uniref:Sterigmatocystin biosynthesis monooxygenase stcW n=1 Tax=Fusarium ambrosium TaxID=131363 RepID=A0A428SXL9_9HYPO|nr:hypothetical protein CDV31_014277 [Fusarium ambrosium]
MSYHNPLQDQAIDKPRQIKVICIGAGFSGILTAIRFPQRIPNLELTIYEKNDDIGGTWYENTYAGVGCDVPSHVYQYSFAGNPNWSKFYAGGAEIQQYLKDVAWRYDVEKYVRLQHHFEKADWDEVTQKWTITVKDLRNNTTVTDTADILIKGTGVLNKWKWPEIKGLHSFRGSLMHTAGWDPKFDWTDKRIALIGAGSSGIQVLPHIRPKAKHVFHYMRGKTWISPVGYAAEVGGGVNRDYTAAERMDFANNPQTYMEYRHLVEGVMNKGQLSTFLGTDIQKQFWKESDAFMRRKLEEKPEIYKSLIPNFPPGCRRLTPGPGYLEALVEDNVTFIGAGIEKVTENGLFDTNGKFHEVDAIICATGFDYSWSTKDTPITGRGGINLENMWDPCPEAYMGVVVPNIPNFFMYLGPAGAPGSGSFITMLEFVVEYIIKCIKKLQGEYISSLEPTSMEAHVDFCKQADKHFEQCKSWFKRNSETGRIVGVWPGSSVHAKHAMENPRFEDFHYVRMPEVEGNRFNWFGNGLTVAQEKSEKTTQYLDDVDIPPIINHGPRPEVNGVNKDKSSKLGNEFPGLV